jgi:hypothetical protein
VKERLMAVLVTGAMLLLALLALLMGAIRLAFRQSRFVWVLGTLLVLAILSGNLPLALVMVLVLGSVVAGQVRG